MGFPSSDLTFIPLVSNISIFAILDSFSDSTMFNLFVTGLGYNEILFWNWFSETTVVIDSVNELSIPSPFALWPFTAMVPVVVLPKLTIIVFVVLVPVAPDGNVQI